MSQFWIQQAAGGQAHGPYGADQLRAMAAAGQIDANWLISKDQVTWHPAGRVKGLFSAAGAGSALAAAPPAGQPANRVTPNRPVGAPPVAAAHASAPARPAAQRPSAMQAPAPPLNTARAGPPAFPVAPAQPTLAPTAAAPPAAASLGYFVNAVDVNGCIARRRSVVPFLVLATLMFLTGSAVFYIANFGNWRHESMPNAIIVPAACTVAFLLLGIPTLIMWLMWAYAAHKDLRDLNGGSVRISPGQAVAFSFIPFFDAFWVVYMPARLASEANRHLAARGLKTIATGGVIACQTISVVTGLFLPGLIPLMYAISMWQIQSGLNRLAAPAGASLVPDAIVTTSAMPMGA